MKKRTHITIPNGDRTKMRTYCTTGIAECSLSLGFVFGIVREYGVHFHAPYVLEVQGTVGEPRFGCGRN